MEKDLNETAVVSFMRMQPPTISHHDIICRMANMSYGLKATPMVYLSHSHDTNKNPLEYQQKATLLVGLSHGVIRYDSEKSIKNIFDLLKHLDGKYKNIRVVCGEDRGQEYTTKLSRYNGVEYNFESIIVNSIKRDGISGTLLRRWASEGNMKDYFDFCYPGTEAFYFVLRGEEVCYNDILQHRSKRS